MTNSEVLLMERVRGGDVVAASELFHRNRERLRTLVAYRIDRRLSQRIDPSDVIQETFVDLQRRLGEYVQDPVVSPLTWMRGLVLQRLQTLHRFHMKVIGRDVRQERRLPEYDVTSDSLFNLAQGLVANSSSPSTTLARLELISHVQKAIESLADVDREIIVLRNFDELTNAQAARVLGLKPAAASNRYTRAIVRLKNIVSELPGFFTDVNESE
ncbi:sigma-70 family RNA polymerase sigma factor [bacterium]|nr:sigma-70 family RNA polymerase sigma factor [bacterium]